MFSRLSNTFLFTFLFLVIVLNSLSAQTITGSYTNTHEISFFDGYDWIETEVADSLILTEIENDSLHFEFYLFHTNGHTCSMDGIAAKIDSVYEYIEIFDEDDQSSECKLQIIINDSEIILNDIDNGCMIQYCGMRGYINGITFRRN
ncbi:MAG: hypothetical protein DRQ01_05005 [Ignavibacteriae bacterium]|nr:MAG: hypothetical protein DRQ01_05005 [Ignavibacteriota bacterium]